MAINNNNNRETRTRTRTREEGTIPSLSSSSTYPPINHLNHPLSHSLPPSTSSSPINNLTDYLFDSSNNNNYNNDSSSSLISYDFAAASSSTNDDGVEFGFSRSEFRQYPLPGSVQFYQRHLFLCYKNPSVWPPRIEAAEFDRLPRLLSASLSLASSNSLLLKHVTHSSPPFFFFLFFSFYYYLSRP